MSKKCVLFGAPRVTPWYLLLYNVVTVGCYFFYFILFFAMSYYAWCTMKHCVIFNKFSRIFPGYDQSFAVVCIRYLHLLLKIFDSINRIAVFVLDTQKDIFMVNQQIINRHICHLQLLTLTLAINCMWKDITVTKIESFYNLKSSKDVSIHLLNQVHNRLIQYNFSKC